MKWISIVVFFVMLHVEVPALAKDYLFVGNTYDKTISVITIPDHVLSRTLDVGGLIDDVRVSPDGKVMYVGFLDGARDTTTPHLVKAFDLHSGEEIWATETRGLPNHFDLSADGKTLIVPTSSEGWLHVIDTATGEIRQSLRVGFGAHSAHFSPDEKTAYIGLIQEEALIAVDLEKLEIARSYPMGAGVRPLAISNDGTKAHMQLSGLNGFRTLDLQSGHVLTTVHHAPLQNPEMTTYPYTVVHALALTSDGTRLFIGHSTDDYAVLYDASTFELLGRVPVGEEPAWAAVSPDGRFGYTSNRGDHTLSIISLTDMKEVKRLKVGLYPQRMYAVSLPD